MTAPVTASMLYDLISCPHRVTMDLFGDPGERDAPNPFLLIRDSPLSRAYVLYVFCVWGSRS